MPAPEKEYFTLTEIMERWARSKIDRTTLLDYARRDLIIYSVYLREIGGHKREIIEPDGAVRTITVTTMQFVAPGFTYQPIRYLKANDARRILEAKEGEQIAVSVLYTSAERNKESGIGYAQPHYFEPKDMLITRSERDRFEKQHKLSTGSRSETFWKWLTDADNQKALTLIGSASTAIGIALWQLYVRFLSQ